MDYLDHIGMTFAALTANVEFAKRMFRRLARITAYNLRRDLHLQRAFMTSDQLIESYNSFF